MRQREYRWKTHIPRLIARLNMNLARYGESSERREMLKFFLTSARERASLLQPLEACQLMTALAAVSKIPGDMAEVGTYEGVSAKLLAATAPERILHVFDTFEGLPEPSNCDMKEFSQGRFRASEPEVRKYLEGFRVQIYKGMFPATARPVTSRSFAFVHLDVDLYESTKACLDFFYPRMPKGGILISHDFARRDAGVHRAFEEFFADKPEPVIELSGDQGMIVKLGQ